MQTFGPHPAGHTWRYTVTPTRPDNTTGVNNGALTVSTSDASLATIRQNGSLLQVDCALLAPGTPIFTVQGTNEDGQPISSQFSIEIVAAGNGNATDHFVFTEGGTGFTNPVI